jgi:histidine triad (HIT) family protein
MSCVFCQIANKEIPAKFIFENDSLMAFNDLHPVAPVHVLIVPKRHISTVNDITTNDELLLGEMVLLAKQIAKDNGIASGGYKLIFNCGENGGQVVQHIHLHLVGGEKIKCIV